MVRNPKLEKLKRRLNSAQFTKRKDRMAQNTSKLKELMIEHAQTRGGVNSVARGVEMVFKSHRITRWALYALGAGQLATLGKVFGLY